MKAIFDYLYFRFYLYMLKVPNRYNAVEGGVLLLTILSVSISFFIYFTFRPFVGDVLRTYQLLGPAFMIIIPVTTYIVGYRRYIKDNNYKNIVNRLLVNHEDKNLFLDVLFVFTC
jgi:hypothetical protein